MWHGWLMTIILATLKTEIREDQGARRAQANGPWDPISKIIRRKWTGGVAQVVEYLLCKCKALTSNPSPTKTMSSLLCFYSIIEYFFFHRKIAITWMCLYWLLGSRTFPLGDSVTWTIFPGKYPLNLVRKNFINNFLVVQLIKTKASHILSKCSTTQNYTPIPRTGCCS
jgi:hypothetical protein